MGQVSEGSVEVISPEEALTIIDSAAQRLLGVTGEDFLKLWEKGHYEGDYSDEVAEVAILIPLLPLAR